MKHKSLLVLAVACVVGGLTASTSATAASAPPKCVTVYDFPDAGLVYCYDLQGDCTLSETRTTFLGTETTCVISRQAASRRSTGPCATQRSLFEKYNIQFDMHQEQVEWLYGEVCRRTG